MGFSQAFKLAFKSLSGSKMRAFLTMLGIIIGVASVIILVSLMQGMTGEVTSMFEDMGTNTLTVSVTGRGSSRTVDVSDLYDLYEENTDVFSAMSPTVSVMGSVKNGTDSDSFDSTSVTGVSEQYSEINKLTLADGRFISYVDLEGRSKVAVVGTAHQQHGFRRQSTWPDAQNQRQYLYDCGRAGGKIRLHFRLDRRLSVPAVHDGVQADLWHDFQLYVYNQGFFSQFSWFFYLGKQAVCGLSEL